MFIVVAKLLKIKMRKEIYYFMKKSKANSIYFFSNKSLNTPRMTIKNPKKIIIPAPGQCIILKSIPLKINTAANIKSKYETNMLLPVDLLDSK
jgi:hypothetical protein